MDVLTLNPRQAIGLPSQNFEKDGHFSSGTGMEALLVKILATALAFSQVTITPHAVKTEFSRDRDQQQVAEFLQAGCTRMFKAFEIENINLDDLIDTAMDDPQAFGGENKEFRGINFGDLQTAYRQFCKHQPVEHPVVDLGEVIDYYNKAASALPDHNKLKGLKLPGESIVLDIKGERFAEMFEENQRRVWIPLAEVPDHVRNSFIAAEDRRYYQHNGVDERGLIRAFLSNLAQSGPPQGGSTITQQLVKNLLVGDDRTYERKIREMIVAVRIESTLTKDEILELYLNSVYLGRGSWGIELAARNYFGKSARKLTLEEGALLAGLTKGPNYFSPDRQPLRAQERLGYVLTRLQEDGMSGASESTDQRSRPGVPPLPAVIPYQRPRRDIGYHFIDEVAREAKSIAAINAITADSYTIRSTINPQLQRAVEEALQEGLFRYERGAGRLEFRGAEANLGQAVQRIEAEKKSADTRPAWQQALIGARLLLYDVHWTPAVVVDKPSGKRGQAWRVGLADGRIVPIPFDSTAVQRKLKIHDVVLVHLSEERGKTSTRAELRVRPVVQGAAVVLENKTGRILAMTGSFSYPLSQLNRATQAARQPGSAIKPLTYLAALGKGLQPNTLISDGPITLRPIGLRKAREQDYWSPKNYDGRGGGTLTLRQALENSRNRATAHLLEGGIESKPEASLNRICDLAVEAQIYRECLRFYPIVLGAQPVRPVDLAAFYAAIANEGLRPSPYVVESIERDGQTVFQRKPNLDTISSVDRPAFYQLKSLLQGVVARGTARSIAPLSPYVAGKTGTTDDENDAWFVGFTNDVTVTVWLGYDNADGQRRTLGSGSTGGAVAVPVFEPIVQAVWARVVPKEVLAAPSAEARRQLSCKSTDVESDRRRRRGGEATTDCFRLDERGRALDTRYRLVSRERDAEDRAKKSEPTSVFESQRRAARNMNPWQTVPQQTTPQWGSTSDNGGRGLVPRSLQDPGLGNSSYYWFRD
jgi:membrane carboxypeptidase/penicillin-binding protein